MDKCCLITAMGTTQSRDEQLSLEENSVHVSRGFNTPTPTVHCKEEGNKDVEL